MFGESKRLRRLNEEDDDYQRSLKGLKEKCFRSGFNERLVTEWIEQTKKWVGRNGRNVEDFGKVNEIASQKG